MIYTQLINIGIENVNKNLMFCLSRMVDGFQVYLFFFFFLFNDILIFEGFRMTKPFQ